MWYKNVELKFKSISKNWLRFRNFNLFWKSELYWKSWFCQKLNYWNILYCSAKGSSLIVSPLKVIALEPTVSNCLSMQLRCPWWLELGSTKWTILCCQIISCLQALNKLNDICSVLKLYLKRGSCCKHCHYCQEFIFKKI